MKMKKNERGITLIALVVTIIVLLILAGITITVVLGEGGIINTALKAKNETEKVAQNEQEQLNELNNYITNGSWESEGGSQGEEMQKVADLAGKPADENKNIEAEDENGNKVVIPTGYRVLAHGTQSEEIGEVVYNANPDHKPCVEDGIVIADSNNNQFVWVPVNNPTEMFEEIEEEQEDGSKIKRNVGILYNFSGTTSTKKTYSAVEYREPDIVRDSDGTDATGDSSYFTESISNTMTEKQFKSQLQNEFDNMKASVEKYKGFYIGRYETGDLSKTQAVVKRNNTDIGNQNWYVMYQKSKTVAAGGNSTSTMIWGCQWDACLRWFQTSKEEGVKNFPTNCEGKANYKGTQGDEDILIPTGTNNDYRVNNIYDMAGNANDWTMEADTIYYRTFRGGFYGNVPTFSPPGLHPYHWYGHPTATHSDVAIGCRISLHVAL